jgi:hypothetical protein
MRWKHPLDVNASECILSSLCVYSFFALKKKLVERSSGEMMMMNREKGKNKRTDKHWEEGAVFYSHRKKSMCVN